jgi:hypothetical protein
MKITLNGGRYRLEISDLDYEEIEMLQGLFPLYSPAGDVTLSIDKECLARLNHFLMERIASQNCNDEHRCITLHTLIDEYVEADGLHEGYPKTWPWLPFKESEIA